MRGSFFAGDRGKSSGLPAVGEYVENLKINIEQIEEPRQLDQRTLSKAFLTEVFADAPSYHPTAATEFTAHLTRVGSKNVLLEGAVTVPLESECRRCLIDVTSEMPVVFTLNMVPRPAEKLEESAGKGRKQAKPKDEEDEESFEEVSETGTDEEFYDGEVIDYAPVLREQLLLGLPAIEPLCQEDCKGLCTTCGQNLNEADCGHSQKMLDPRWDALKNIKV
jgi:uncharacterized protein